MTGVLLAVPPADFVLHNSLFLVAHFHNVIIGGVLFGAFAGYEYWFPKAFGFKLHEGLGKAAFWLWTIGFYLAFMPLYVLGLMGMTRRMQHYDVPGWQPWLLVAAAGAALIAVGIASRSCSWSGASAIARRCATAPAIRGTAARSNGRCRRRRRCSTSPSCRRSRARTPTGGSSSARSSADAASRARVPRHPHASQQPGRLHLRVLRDHHGLRPDLAHLVAGAVRLVCAYATFVVFAWRDEHEEPIPAATVAAIDRANRSARREALAQLRPAT